MNFLRSFLGQIEAFTGPLGRYVKQRWLRTLIWTFAAVLIIWFYGDMLRLGRFTPFASDEKRKLAVVALVVGWAAYNIVTAIRDRRRNRALISALTAEQQADRDLPAQEVEQIRTRLQEAMTQLRKVTGSKRNYVYKLPWYIMIGPPGSGKTTALLNSGLNLPLAGSMGQEPMRGVGGTRNCDWWFTEDAILLDAAGRYTTQDSDPELDKKGWQGFLELLKQYRPLQPINGVIVAMSLEDMAARDPQDRLAHAQAIRRRLTELTESFGARFPVYFLLTKADLLAGFVEFFDAFNRGDREQPWGMTFPLDDGREISPPAIGRFGAEFDLLLKRLNLLVLERMQQETDVDRRGLIYGFPLQMATLKEAIGETLTEIFTTSRFEKRPMLRGIYLVSSTQKGVPIDRMMHAMGSILGVEVPRQSVFAGKEKSYFLTRLLKAVIFAEANLVVADPRARRRLSLTRNIALGSALAVLLVFLGAWTFAYRQNERLVATANQQIALYDKEVGAVPESPVGDTDFRQIVPPLDLLRDGPASLRSQSASLWLHGGLDQTVKLGSQYGDAYRRALNGMLLPRVLVFLQKQIRARETDIDFVLASTRVYLGLGGQGPLDAGFARGWMSAEWRDLYPDASDAGLRRDLDDHFAALLDGPLTPVALDSALIAETRQALSRQPLAARAYAILRNSSQATQMPPWTVLDRAGPLADRVFVRPSGAPLSQGVPGIFTRAGYLKVFLPQLHDATHAVRKESWIYGPTAENTTDDALEAQVLALYRSDFDTAWTSLLADLEIVHPADLGMAVQILNGLTGPDSALRQLLLAVAADSNLQQETAAKDTQSQQIAKLVATPNVIEPTQASDTLQPLRAMTIGAEGQPSQLDGVLKTLSDLYQEVSRANGALPQASSLLQAEGGVNDANESLVSEARQLPNPVDKWMSELAENVRALSSGGAQSQISQLWQASGARFCRQAVNGRYPFFRGASSEISIDDFDKLFASGGVLDSFFSQNLRQFVNTARHPWQWQYAAAKGVSSASLSAFERADAVRQAFFGPSGGQAGFDFEVTPRFLDTGANGVTLDLQGQTLSYAHGPLRPMTMHWPASIDAGSRINFQPGFGQSDSQSGAWSTFRLIEDAHVETTSGDSFVATFVTGLRSASFDFRSDSVLNPLNLRLLRSFHCPAGL